MSRWGRKKVQERNQEGPQRRPWTLVCPSTGEKADVEVGQSEPADEGHAREEEGSILGHGKEPVWLASIHSSHEALPAAQLGSHSTSGVRRCDPKNIWEIELIAHELERLFGSGRFLVRGDLNSALLFDETYGRTSNARLFENLASAGFIDLRRRFFETEQQTYFKKGKGRISWITCSLTRRRQEPPQVGGFSGMSWLCEG